MRLRIVQQAVYIGGGCRIAAQQAVLAKNP
jgi:hypothetical protein